MYVYTYDHVFDHRCSIDCTIDSRQYIDSEIEF